MSLDAPAPEASPGRSCPLHYRYAPAVFNTGPSPGLADCEVLYVVGGLYGNEAALERVLALFDQERGRKRLVFNGDFHWFDIDPARFARIQRSVLVHHALRGNVETELAEPDPDEHAGCGCAYPEWVGQGVVERSNRILAALRQTAARHPVLQQELGALPMWLRADVGGFRVAVVHGDAESLAGWGFDPVRLADAGHRRQVAQWFSEAQVDAFACTHTCMPVLRQFGPADAPGFVLNNGAAGMPNFAGWRCGLITRVALRPFTAAQRRYGLQLAGERGGAHHGPRGGPGAGGVFLDAIDVDYDHARWAADFLAQWPPGSDAHASYWQRIDRGLDWTVAQALGTSS